MESKKMRPTRYAHFEGHTDLCYTNDGRYIITCGTDGEVRVFEGLDDDDCKTHVVAECAHSIAYQDGRFLVGTDSNLVQAYTLDEGSPDGIITRFTAPTTHIVVSKDAKTVVCAGSDMTIKVHDTVAYKDKVLNGHQAPVLSVALDPKGEFVASSSCDGSVKMWDLQMSVTVASWNVVPKTNSFSSSLTLCRMAWTPDGQYLLVPAGMQVNAYARKNWQIHHSLEHESIKEMVSLAAVSSCGRFVAGACRDGVILVWDANSHQIILSEKHPKGLAITGMAWNPSGKEELAFVDCDGQLGTLENIIEGDYVSKPGKSDTEKADGVFPPVDVDMGEEDDEFSLARIKQQLGFADDEQGTFVGLPEDNDLLSGDPRKKVKDDDTASIVTTKTEVPPAPVMKLPEIQKPFQPGMSPEHLNDRYMLWNNVGIVRQYSSEDENSIDVEFHDTSVHHALHLNNNSGHSMAALSTQALALACEAQDDQPSKLAVQHFSAWGGSKEWHVDMPSEEEILALCIGVGWLAVATDRRNLRIFSTSGIQRDVLSIPGPVVCLAAFEEQLMVVFHSGMGVSGDQHMAAIVLSVNGNKHPVPLSCPLPLSPRSYLAWAGFTDEGTPAVMDSAGIIRMMHFKYGYNWTVILNTKNHTKGKSDNYFMLGVSETQGNVRCILCKGGRYPPVLPKPHVSIISIQVPLCELETEKGGLEEKTLRSGLLLNSLERLGRQGYDIEDSKNEADKILKEAMIKLFALACRTERESRALEVCQLMPSYHTVQLAIKYAGKLHRLQLADKLGEVASAKMQEEMERAAKAQGVEEDDLQMYGSGMRRIRTRDEDEDEEDDYSEQVQESVENEEAVVDNPLLAAASRRENTTPRGGLLSSQNSKNPFKKSGTPSSAPQSGKRGINVIDQFRKAQKKMDSSPVLRPVVKKPQAKQTTLKKESQEEPPVPSGKENVSENIPEETPKPSATNPFKKVEKATDTPPKKQSALQLWLADNEKVVKEKYPDASEKDLLAKAAMMFKDVDADTKQKYKALATGTPTATTTPAAETTTAPNEEDKKRKREETTPESPIEKKAKGSGLNKLAAFAFNKDS
ncbi:WD repeat and HMG-box DNA-binding protein 1 [Penaeus vannamei]|uniref:WD repeat and HMG-box DNA-binding protein 1 n=1 Tax=Penaeus vannamei TaxID=6689 RepID=UPI00387F9053